MSSNVAAAPTDVLEERLIDAEYKIWKKNTPYLYDFVLTHSLEWPSLTCQWLPTLRNAGDNATEHSLLLGTHTTGEQNYLMIGSCALPRDDDVVDPNAAAKSKSAPQYDDEKKEVGGFGHGNSNVGKIEIKLKVKHEGEVNRARYMPQNHFIVASRGPSAEVYIFDLSKHPSVPSENSPFTPQGVCVGHEKEGYGMAWSQLNEGQLLTASEDKTVKLWDVSAATASKAETGTQIKPLVTFNGHEQTVEDVDWHPMDPKLIASVGDDKIINLWDVRASSSGAAAGGGVQPMHTLRDAHDSDINCVSFCPGNEHVFATGSADKTVALWDMRKLKTYVAATQYRFLFGIVLFRSCYITSRIFNSHNYGQLLFLLQAVAYSRGTHGSGLQG
jgi:histone-binding protein RBBP4